MSPVCRGYIGRVERYLQNAFVAAVSANRVDRLIECMATSIITFVYRYAGAISKSALIIPAQ
jgi:hypothetical protein